MLEARIGVKLVQVSLLVPMPNYVSEEDAAYKVASILAEKNMKPVGMRVDIWQPLK